MAFAFSERSQSGVLVLFFGTLRWLEEEQQLMIWMAWAWEVLGVKRMRCEAGGPAVAFSPSFISWDGRPRVHKDAGKRRKGEGPSNA